MSTVKEPCSGCGQETAAETPLFASRRRVDAGDGVAFVCSECVSRIQRGELRLSSPEVMGLIDATRVQPTPLG